jgi:glycosyltransferase involved in cell wall biosynthesis
MFQFNNKNVFIISFERWGEMKISKHHYAIELARKNCNVFFIEAPLLSNKGVTIDVCDDHPNIKIVKYKPVYRAKRFLPHFIFSFLLKCQIKILLKTINVKPDIVWCFHGSLFENLKWFGAPVTIFFAADILDRILPPEIYTADIVFGVSDTIVKQMEKTGKPVFQINHGLQKIFVENANQLINSEIKDFVNHNVITVGYSGNLRMAALDKQTMIRVINNSPTIKFIFWGTYTKQGSNLGPGFEDGEVDIFIEFLENANNVQLRGAVSSEQLQLEMKEVDMFWLCWNLKLSPHWDGSNSHKILEYLSTGKPVVSHYVSSYKDYNLLYMLPSKDSNDYEFLFNKGIEKIKMGELKADIMKRLSFAVDNSYEKQVSYIEEKINSLSLL